MRRAIALGAACMVLAGCGGGVDQAAKAVASQAPVFFQDGLVHATLRAKIAAIDVDAATSVGIAVHQGHVTLTGTVRSAKERDELVRTASSRCAAASQRRRSSRRCSRRRARPGGSAM